jgi:uncharacterized protein YecT (DUF1311 family)
MARRINLTELMEIRERRGRRGHGFPHLNDVQELKDAWAQSETTDGAMLFASLLPARIVTFIEVCCRNWVQRLIDHGPPYVERAVGLKADIKYDHALVRSLSGQTISLGFLLSHNIPLSPIGAIDAAFTTLLGEPFFDWLSKVRARVAMEHDDDGGAPIVTDLGKLKRALARMFDVRHILVHEFPEKLPFEMAEIPEMLDAADVFIKAADEGFTQLLYGLYPISQRAMNRAAQEEREAVERELDQLVDDIAEKLKSDAIREVQKAWRAFAKAEADRKAAPNTGGSIYPLVYHGAFKELASDRLDQLKRWFEEEFLWENE